MQRRTRTRVLGYHSTSPRTRSSVSFNGLELELERRLERAAQQTKNYNKARVLIVIDYKRQQLECDETNGSLTSSVSPSSW